MELLLDIVQDAVKDTAGLVPFLFATYLVLEGIEHTAGSRVNALVRRAGAAGPVVGALAGIVPQCGFSAMGATLYAGRVVTLGTLVAVFLSTSDEMLPLLVAEQVDARVLGSILLGKAALALVWGAAIDAALRVLRARPRAHSVVRRGVFGSKYPSSLVDELAEAGEGAEHIHELCERAHCGCDDAHAHEVHSHGAHEGHEGHVHGHDHSEHGMLRSVLHGAVSHTVQVTLFIFVVTLVLAGVIDTVGEDVLVAFLQSNELLAAFAAALVGLIPNCAASVVITQLYLEGALALGPLMAGSLAAAGAGYLVLFRTNASARENAFFVALLYGISVLSGFVIMAMGI